MRIDAWHFSLLLLLALLWGWLFLFFFFVLKFVSCYSLFFTNWHMFSFREHAKVRTETHMCILIENSTYLGGIRGQKHVAKKSILFLLYITVWIYIWIRSSSSTLRFRVQNSDSGLWLRAHSLWYNIWISFI